MSHKNELRIGQRVEIPLGHGDYIQGHIIEHLHDAGKIKVQDDEGELWIGYEYLAEPLPDNTTLH